MKLFSFRRKGFPLLVASVGFLLIGCAVPFAQVGQDDVETASAKTWVGKKAKGFAVPGIDGKMVDVAKNLGKRPVVLVFYRGVW
jgi:hypothetical protein